jgi:amidase
MIFLHGIQRCLTYEILDTGPEQYKDAPVCVQLVGYRHQDEGLMHTAFLVDSILHGKK